MKQSESPTPPALFSRRDFCKGAVLAGGTVVAAKASSAEDPPGAPVAFAPPERAALEERAGVSTGLPDLRPARWLWYPSERCLAGTVVLFRRAFDLPAKPHRAAGWVIGCSRYLFFANARRIQFGPAPCDPRYEEIDPIDLSEVLRAGRNVIGAQVLYYGHGDGTWPAGKPGFLFRLEIDGGDGQKQVISSDETWQAHLARAWPPGQYKRWFLRAFQEEFDARLHPAGWSGPDFSPNRDWVAPMVLDCPADKPSIASTYGDYALDIGAARAGVELRPRSIPLLRETLVPVKQLTESLWIDWERPPEEYFECVPPGAFRFERGPVGKETAPGVWRLELDGRRAAALTFELGEQGVGWPFFTIEAPAGTTIELMVHEAHQPGGPALLNTHFHAWTRFICREGLNRFETFDFESCRWIQLHIRNTRGPVIIRDVGLRRRLFPWPHEPQVTCSDPALQKLIRASINTLHNSAQETVVDGMGRERQQYSGDGGHQLHAIYFAFGETRLPARFVTTFSQGLTQDGYFLDCWPAYDRLARLMERQLDFTPWGPLLDHGVGFNFDCLHFLLHTGNLKPLAEAYPRLLRFAQYLKSIQRPDGLLPVERIGVPAVWIDHQAYRHQHHKQCAFNLYAAAMLEHALPSLARAFGDDPNEQAARRFGAQLRAAAVRQFWSPQHQLFVINLPWLAQEKEFRLCDRSLATAILFDQCPDQQSGPAIRTLADAPSTMGESYPCNAGWRYWALAKGRRIDVVLHALRERWATMPSVSLNNTLQEDWVAHPDSGAQWSHCALAPLYCLFMSIAGIRPLAPGFARCEIQPQPGDLENLDLTTHTVRGPLRFRSQGQPGTRQITLTLPEGCTGELLVDPEEKLPLNRLSSTPDGLARYVLPAGQTIALQLKKT